MANCTTLPPLPVKAAEPVVDWAAVILPNSALVKAVAGFANRTLLVMLKPSARTSRRWPSVIRNCLETAWSHSQNPGPLTLATPIFP